MPIYEYKCASCNTTFDTYVKTQEEADEVSCPGCGSPEVERQISSFNSSSGDSGNPAPKKPFS